MIRISKLDALPVLDAAGAELGRLHELHAVGGRVTKLVYGSAGWFERLTGRRRTTAVPWSLVAKVEATCIRLK